MYLIWIAIIFLAVPLLFCAMARFGQEEHIEQLERELEEEKATIVHVHTTGNK